MGGVERQRLAVAGDRLLASFPVAEELTQVERRIGVAQAALDGLAKTAFRLLPQDGAGLRCHVGSHGVGGAGAQVQPLGLGDAVLGIQGDGLDLQVAVDPVRLRHRDVGADPVVGHGGVALVVRLGLPHVALHAVVRHARRRRARRSGAPAGRHLMAFQAGVAVDGTRPRRAVDGHVGVVAGHAVQASAALQEAGAAGRRSACEGCEGPSITCRTCSSHRSRREAGPKASVG